MFLIYFNLFEAQTHHVTLQRFYLMIMIVCIPEGFTTQRMMNVSSKTLYSRIYIIDIYIYNMFSV